MPVLVYDEASRSVTVPGKNGKTINATLEDIGPSAEELPFSKQIFNAVSTLVKKCFG